MLPTLKSPQTLRYLLLFIALLPCSMILAQHLDYDQVVIPEGQPPRVFEDCLVQLAWLNSPANTVFEHHKIIAGKEFEKTKKEWLEDVVFTFNVNESHLNRPSAQDSVLVNNTFFPRYNLGATFNLGKLLNRKHDIAISQQEMKIAELEENQQKLEVRALTLQRYEQHLLTLELEKIKIQAETDAEEMYLIASERFKTDRISFQEYNTSSNQYFTSKSARLQANSDVQQSIFALEELIGVPWEKVEPKREQMERRNKKRN